MNVPQAVAVVVASVVAFFCMGYALAGWLYDSLKGRPSDA